MIVSRSQQHHLMRRVTEERKWLHLTMAIIVGFTVSVVPVFVCYILWVSHVRTPPYVGEINFIINIMRKLLTTKQNRKPERSLVKK